MVHSADESKMPGICPVQVSGYSGVSFVMSSNSCKVS